VLLGLFAILLATGALPGGGPAQAGQKLLIGTTSSSSSHYGYFVAVSQLINQQISGVEASVVETGATLDNLRRIKRKQIDFGLVTTNVLYAAYQGKGEFEGAPVKAKLLWVYDIAPQNVVVRADSGITSLAALNGRKFNPGLKGSATENTTEAVLKVLAIAPDYVRGSTGDIVGSIKDNRVTGYVKSGAGLKLDSSSRDIATMTPIRLLGIDAAQQQKLAAAMPEVSLVDVPKSEPYDAYSTWGFAVAAAAGPELDEETAYRIVKAVCEDKEAQANAYGGVKGADFVADTLKFATVPLHPGTIRYFKERGVLIPDRLIEK
jgi:TRAP transporter TAXI family solute receptor